jgi:adenylate kinase
VLLVGLLFGPPGCGKGTQAVFLAERFQTPVISTGEMFRAEQKAGSELGRMASAVLAAGGLVGDDVVNQMVAGRIGNPDCADGFFLDGYPRTVSQARYFSSLLEMRGLGKPVILHIQVSEDILVSRLSGRRQCPQCFRIYNLTTKPPQRPGVCDHDGAALSARDDDQEAVIRQRLRAYESMTGPVLAWFGQSAVMRIDGALEPSQVFRAIECRLANGEQPARAAAARPRLAS